VLPALDATTEVTFKIPVAEMFATTLPSVPLNSTNGAVAPLAALNTTASSLTVISGAVSNLKRAMVLL